MYAEAEHDHDSKPEKDEWLELLQDILQHFDQERHIFRKLGHIKHFKETVDRQNCVNHPQPGFELRITVVNFNVESHIAS